MQRIVVDWGSSCLRSFLLGPAGNLLASRQSADGILTLKKSQFAEVIAAQCQDWLVNCDLLLMAGMVGSRHGWNEMPYLPCPLNLSTLAAGCQKLPAELMPAICSDLPWPQIQLVPGLTCHNNGVADVMRGEETQIFGALATTGQHSAWICLPGTHSKWALVQQGTIVHFHSFITGELFALLKTHSSLAAFCQQDTPDQNAFHRGLQLSATANSNLLHQLFSVRAQVLTGQLPAQHASALLSGLLIGHEFVSAKTWLTDSLPLFLVGNPQLNALYQLAANYFNYTSQDISAETASLAGFNALVQQIQQQAGTGREQHHACATHI
jgi:2-dehydro-3-deoxygalactonokinase